MNDLHGKIMNLQANPDHWDASSDGRLTYKQGHRDARHDAAELALAADQEIDALRAQLATARADALRAAAEACSDEYFREMSSISDGAVMELCDKQMEASKRSILALIDKEPRT